MNVPKQMQESIDQRRNRHLPLIRRSASARQEPVHSSAPWQSWRHTCQWAVDMRLAGNSDKQLVVTTCLSSVVTDAIHRSRSLTKQYVETSKHTVQAEGRGDVRL